MANKKLTPDEQIILLQERQKKLKERERKIKSQQAQKERRERTKRLIEIGAVVESVLGRPILKDDLINLKCFLENQEQRGKFFSKAMGATVAETNSKTADNTVQKTQN